MAVVLALRALGLGDFLTGVPAYRALRAAYPDARLVLAAPGALVGLARLTGAVDRVHDTRGLAPLRWSGPPPEVAVNLHGRGPQSHRVLAALGPGRLLAFSLDGGTPSWRPGEHEVARWCRMLAECGIPADPTALGLAPPPVTSPAPGAVVVHAGAADPARYWPVERFAVVAAALAARGHRVVLTGTRAERHRVAAVATGAGLPPSAVLAGRTDLTGLAALVAGARLVVSVDTGVAHLATAYRTRSVVLFGPVPPHEWGPPADPRHAVLYREAGLARIGVGEVLAAVDRQLDGAGEAGRGGDDPDPPATPAASAGAGR